VPAAGRLIGRKVHAILASARMHGCMSTHAVQDDDEPRGWLRGGSPWSASPPCACPRRSSSEHLHIFNP
jgi:hypothetical protein